jgi:hypothetical protein
MASRKEQKERARQQRLAAERAAAEQAAKRRRLRLGGGVGVAIVAGVVIAIVAASSGGASHGGGGSGPTARLSTTSTTTLGHLQPVVSEGPLGTEGVPVPKGPALASAASSQTGQTVDQIQCNSTEQTLFHIHAHVTIFVNGAARQIPEGVGIVTSEGCLHWLHTHAPDGIIHIESPVHRTFTLGNFFDVWHQPLGPDQVGPARGHVTAFYNGALYRGDPRNIPLNAYSQVQLDVGTPLIAPETISFAGTGL